MSSKVDPMVRARTQLTLDHPFFACLALRTLMVVDNTQPTGWCDGIRIGYNEEFVKGLNEAQVIGFLIHELYHKVFLHGLRQGSREHDKWNIAADYAINQLIDKIPRVQLPDKALLDPKYDGMSAEEIYDILPPQPPCGGGAGQGRPDGDPGGCGATRKPPTNDQTRAEIEARVKQDIAAAAHIAKLRGNMPAGLEIYLDELLEPTVPWRQQLLRFMTERARGDYTWQKPNRRFVGHDLYLPSLRSEDAAGVFAFGVDTSGSMGQDLQLIMSEVNGVMEQIQPERSHVIYCDAAVGRHDIFERGEELEVSVNGGGGTDFRPVFDCIDENNIAPKCLIFLTDGCGLFPAEEPPYPVLWVMTTDVEPPFGETLRVKD